MTKQYRIFSFLLLFGMFVGNQLQAQTEKSKEQQITKINTLLKSTDTSKHNWKRIKIENGVFILEIINKHNLPTKRVTVPIRWINANSIKYSKRNGNLGVSIRTIKFKRVVKYTQFPTFINAELIIYGEFGDKKNGKSLAELIKTLVVSYKK